MKKKGLVLGAIGVVSLIGGACAFLLHRKSKIDKFDVDGDFPFGYDDEFDDEGYGDFSEDREYQTFEGEYPLDDDCCDDDEAEESSSLEEDWADMKEEWDEMGESRNEQEDVEFPEDDE